MWGFALRLLPGWAWLAAAGVALATAWGWHAHAVHQARVQGRAEVQARWDAAELARERQANVDAARRAEQSIAAAAAHEAARAAIARNLTEARHDLRNALSAPISCPPGQSGMEVGDVLLPAAVLDGVRRAAEGGGGQRADRPAAAEPGRAMP